VRGLLGGREVEMWGEGFVGGEGGDAVGWGGGEEGGD